MSRVIGVFSGKGGVGKTTLVANLGVTLSNGFKKNVIIFDNNIHSSHLGLHFGLYEDFPVTLRDVLKRHASIMQAIYIHPETGMRIIAAPLNGLDLNLTKKRCCNLVNQVKKNYDMVILDCAPGLSREVIIPMQVVDEAIVISTADIAALTDAMKTIEILKKFKKTVLGIVINRYQNQKYELTPQEISSTSNSNIIGVIPEDTKVPDSIAKGVPVVISYPYSKASRAFRHLGAFLIGETYKEESLLEKLRGLFNFKLLAPKQKTEPAVQQQAMRKEISDTIELKDELTKEIKEELKRELMKKVRAKLKERMHEN